LAVLSLPLGGCAGIAAVTPCTDAAAGSDWQAPEVSAGDVDLDFETLVATLQESRVVLVGESHVRYDHHLDQLEIICRLHRRDPDLAIGMEAFQQPFQSHLDDFVAGRIDTTDMIRTTEYYSRWQFDYRLYEPIITFARERGIPIVALNVPAEITRKVGQDGIASLSDEERARIPRDMDPSDPRHRERLRSAFEEHPEEMRGDFERFYEVQLLWDEGMAERAARFLEENPGTRLVVLAGAGHVVRSGIPSRLARRRPEDTVTVLLHDRHRWRHGEDADFLLTSTEIVLPPAGMLGVMLDTESGGIGVQEFAPNSAAEDAGLEIGDRIVALDGQSMSNYAALKIGLLDKRPGDTVSVEVERKTAGDSAGRLVFEVTLR
jgi:uncharacterized iron-regulated protein